MDAQNKEFRNYVVTCLKPIYCAAPLFSPIARMAAANLAAFVEYDLKHHCQSEGISYPSAELVFLPYRDTKQDTIQGFSRARRIYEADILRLAQSSCLLARFDNLAKDTGVSMEIGYAYCLGIPIGILVTDFIWEGHVTLCTEWQFDPVIDLMASVMQCVPASYPITGSYYQTNILHEHEAVRQFTQHCLSTFQVNNEPSHIHKQENGEKGVFVDIMGGRYEWAAKLQDEICDALAQSNISAFSARRYQDTDFNDVQSVQQSARQDFLNLLKCRVLVLSGDAPEIEPGSAALFGVAKAMKMVTVYQHTSPICYKGLGQQIMKINLMIEQGADHITSSCAQTINTVNTLVDK